MPIVLTDAQKNELKSAKRPTFYRRATIIKNPYNADTRESIEISEHVESWGKLKIQNTMIESDWEFPNLTVIAVNNDNLFTAAATESVWQTGPAGTYTVVANPRDCHLLVEIYMMMFHHTEAVKLLDYRGRIDQVIPRRDEEYAVVEIVTTMEQAKNLREMIPRNGVECWPVPCEEL